MATIIQLRRDNTVNWADADPILAEGEMGWEKSGNEITAYKIGDGVRKWSELPYGSNISILQELGDSETATMSQKAITDSINYTCVEIVGFGINASSAGVTKTGDVYYKTDTNQLRKCSNYENSTFITLRVDDSTLIYFNEKYYLYSDLTKKGTSSLFNRKRLLYTRNEEKWNIK